ncbi:MAG: ComEC/Rec2 family competence protein, partial [Planctomycetota bacterium]
MSSPSTQAPERILVAAACVVAGILLAGACGAGSIGDSFWRIWWFAVLSYAASLAVTFARARPGLVHASCLAVAVVAVSAAWTTLRHHRIAAGDLRALARPGEGVVRLSGTVVADAVTFGADAAALARFHYRPERVRFELAVDTAIDRHGHPWAARGRVLVVVGEATGPLRGGDRVRVTGRLRPPSPPRNPGAVDRRPSARARGFAGVVTTPRRDLIAIERRGDDAFRHWRATLRRGAARRLLDDLPDGASAAARDALLTALLLGARGSAFGPLHDAFRRVGLAHLLAISGLHLGVIVGCALLAARLAGTRRRAPQGWLVIGVVIAYLVLVEARLPVLRAGLMASAVGLGMIARRRWPTESLVLASALVLLAWRPGELTNPGFQLSYGVVLGLLRGVPAVRARWFPAPPGGAGTIADVLGSYLVGAWCVAVVAWVIAMPIVLHHFGTVSPGTVPLSVLSLPVATAVLVIGYAKMIASAVLPCASMLLAPPLAAATDLLRLLVAFADAVPGSVLHLPRPRAAWTAGALALGAAWITGAVRSRRVLLGAAALLTASLAWPLVVARPAPALVLDTLAVGDGTCHVVRSGGRTWLFDAGSAADPGAGRRTIVPALRALGVRAIDILCISHPNLDHFSAVPEIVARLPVGEVLVTPAFVAAGGEPDTAARALLDVLARHRVPVATVGAGHRRRLGRATARWLHPTAAATPSLDNDGSMVVAMDAGARRVLFTGDIETAAIEDLLARHPGLHADVLELPHHGSDNDAARRLVERLAPAVVVQSTGPARLVRDAWADLPEPTRRLV